MSSLKLYVSGLSANSNKEFDDDDDEVHNETTVFNRINSQVNVAGLLWWRKFEYCNTKKTVCMVFAPCNKSRIVWDVFPNLVLCGQPLRFGPEFRYFGHIISNQHKDDSDIAREIRCVYTRVNMHRLT